MRIETKINDEECRIDVDGKTIIDLDYGSVSEDDLNFFTQNLPFLKELKKLNKLIKILAPDAEIIEK